MTDTTHGRLPRTGRDTLFAGAPHAALLIDFDNVTLGIRSDLQTQLRLLLNSDIIKGKVSVQRAYADWRRYPQYIVPLSEASIDLIFAPAFGANKKNATDIRLAIDALELVFTRPEIGTYILLSGDSDFSALVLKLKEHGKYVIGVGLRESSSDLLIQNCDEYFSYSELTGLTKTGEIEHAKRDPWELVVEAVQEMREGGDVMRSDRLKQVMLSIDPRFVEKEAGFNRFSKFVVEAGRRGLLSLTRLDNGQHEIDLGPNANVLPVAQESSADAPAKKPPSRSRRRGGRRPEAAPSAAHLTLSETFDLLRDALTAIGAVGKTAADAERVRERMQSLAPSGDDPVFDPKRFPRMLRQAHDAGLIEMIKSGRTYQLRLSSSAEQPAGAAVEPEAAAGDEATDTAGASETERRSTRRGRSSRRGKSQKTEPDATPADDAAPEPSPSPPPDKREAERDAPQKRASARVRRGSKGAPRAARPAEPGAERAAPSTSPYAEVTVKRRALGARRGSRGGKGDVDRSARNPAEGASPKTKEQETPTGSEAGAASESTPPRGSL